MSSQGDVTLTKQNLDKIKQSLTEISNRQFEKGDEKIGALGSLGEWIFGDAPSPFADYGTVDMRDHIQDHSKKSEYINRAIEKINAMEQEQKPITKNQILEVLNKLDDDMPFGFKAIFGIKGETRSALGELRQSISSYKK